MSRRSKGRGAYQVSVVQVASWSVKLRVEALVLQLNL